MRAGSIKKTGKVRHLIIEDKFGTTPNFQFDCGTGFLYYASQIDFKTTKPPCRNCVNKQKGDRYRAVTNLAKLGVK